MAREQLARRRGGGKGEYVATASEKETVPSGLIGGAGWESHDVKRDSKGYPRYGIEEGTVSNLVKFTQDGYFAWFLRHWVNKIPYVCRDAEETGCPLCERDVKAQISYLFNVIDMTGDKEPELKVWEASADPFGAIKARAEDSKYSPINKDDLYFSISKKKQDNGFNKFSVDPVKRRDLKEDFGLEPLTDEEYARLTEKLFDESIVWVAPREDLVKAAATLED